MRRLMRGGIAVASIGMGALIGVPHALAHDSVIGGDPADGAVISEFPQTLDLEFSGQPQEGFSTVALSRVEDTGEIEVIHTGEPTIEGRMVSLNLPEDVREELEGAAGEYQIGFQIISSDGHATKGMTTFTYEPAGTPATATIAGAPGNSEDDQAASDAQSAEAEEVSGASSSMAIVLAILGVVIVAAAAIAALARRNKSAELDK